MSTKREREIQWKNFQARRNSRVTHLHSGYTEIFGDGRAETAAASQFARLDDPGSGWLPREGNTEADPNSWRDDITAACNFIQRAIDKTGDLDGLNDGLRTLFRTCDILRRIPDGFLIPKAAVNRSGPSRPPVNVPSNDQARNAGSRNTVVITAELAAKSTATLERLISKYRQYLHV
jgi:hypothetical protein